MLRQEQACEEPCGLARLLSLRLEGCMHALRISTDGLLATSLFFPHNLTSWPGSLCSALP